MGLIGTRSAIVAPIRLPHALEAIRRAHVAHARVGVPAHVTLLFPFVSPPSLDDVSLERAAAAVAGTPSFDVEFVEVAAWGPGPTTPEGVAWLPPVPSAPFVALTEALVDAFPAYQPYEGVHDEVIPHLTLANEAVDLAAIRERARRQLPFARRVTSAVLLIEGAGGRWRIARRLPLSPAPPGPPRGGRSSPGRTGGGRST